MRFQNRALLLTVICLCLMSTLANGIVVRHDREDSCCRVNPIDYPKVCRSHFPMSPIVFHLTHGMPGYFGIALDDSGKIDHLSLFV